MDETRKAAQAKTALTAPTASNAVKGRALPPDCAWDAAAQTLVFSGDWTLEQLASKASRKTLSKAKRLCKQHAGNAGTVMNVQQVAQLDHLGGQWLWQHVVSRLGADWQERVQTSTEQPAQLAMLQRVAQFTATPEPEPGKSVLHPIMVLGDAAFVFVQHARGFVQILGQLVLDVLYIQRYPRKAPWRDISGHIFNMGTTAMPITALVGFLIGIVLTYLMALQLQQFGADTFIVNILGISLTRELGPMLAAILIAGRSGSAITAQIGVMRVNEELDAMQVMGISHGFRLVMPRAIALLVAMPLLSLWTTIAAMTGGILVSQLVLGISASFFLESLPNAVEVVNLWLALAKSAVFGVCIALVGCHFGLRVKPNTQSLGEGTTASVVAAITLVILIDAVFAVAFKAVGV